MYPLIGLNLLRLLSQNRLSDFHTSLETIDPEQLQTNQYIKQAVDLGKTGGVGHRRKREGLTSVSSMWHRTILDGRKLQQSVEHKKHSSR
jgi:hypothetical protein